MKLDISIVNELKSCSVCPKIPNSDEIFSGPWNKLIAGLHATTRLKLRHLSMIGAILLANESGIPSEFMLIVKIEFV